MRPNWAENRRKVEAYFADRNVFSFLNHIECQPRRLVDVLLPLYHESSNKCRRTIKKAEQSWFASKSLNFFVFCFPAYSKKMLFKQLPVSHEVQLRFTEALHRCLPLDAVHVYHTSYMFCVAWTNPTHFFVWGPERGMFASCWNQARISPYLYLCLFCTSS